MLFITIVYKIAQLEWKEEIMQKFSSVQKERAPYPRLEDDLLQRRRQELQYAATYILQYFATNISFSCRIIADTNM